MLSGPPRGSFPHLLLLHLGGVGNGDLNLHTGLDVDGGDLLDDLGGRVKVNDLEKNCSLAWKNRA